jgi:hypothetical protein
MSRYEQQPSALSWRNAPQQAASDYAAWRVMDAGACY